MALAAVANSPSSIGRQVVMKHEYCVVTVDGTRARFFCLERPELKEMVSWPQLVEESEALINTEVDIPGRELFSDSKSGRMAAPNGMAHGYDDHRAQHSDEVRRRFAKLVADELLRLAERRRPQTVVLAADQQMLGFLRGAIHVPPKAQFEVKEVVKDLSRLSPQELYSHLAAEGMLPEQHKPKQTNSRKLTD